MKHALSRCQKDFFYNHLIVAYFFNARGETLEKTPLGLLRSITYQLLQNDDALYENFAPWFREKQRLGGGATWQWHLTELQEFIRLVIKQSLSRPLLLLVDALDECDQSDVRTVVGFLESLSIYASKDGILLHICLSSRHYPSIRMDKVVELAIDKSLDHEKDITKYIRERLRIRDVEMEAEIAKRADSVFLWVVIVVSLLNKAYDEGRVEAMRRMLEEIPGDLERIFSTILNTDTADAAETILMLQWVLLSQRPLKPRELFAAIVRVAPPAIEMIQRRITTSSKGLIEVRKGGAESVQFIHLSVSDFLVRHKRLQMLDPTLGPEPVMASHGRLWARCWSCIQQVDTTRTSAQHMAKLKDEYPFLGYAASYILGHAERALSRDMVRQGRHRKRRRGEDGSESATSQQTSIQQWLREPDGWVPWWKLFLAAAGHDDEQRMLGDDVDVGLVYILAHLGLPNLLRMILEGADVNAQGGRYGNALQAASVRGDREIVQLLLDAGADINAQGGEHDTALQAASHCEHREIVQLLLNTGADVNAQGGFFGNALQAASHWGHREIVQLLLNASADVHAQGGVCGNALPAASFGGDREIVQLLLDAGADINAQGGEDGNALQTASGWGNREIVQLLLDAGADINAQGGEHGNALQAASHWATPEIVQLLLNAGADVHANGGRHGNALQAASAQGQRETVQLLLDAGADINAQGGRYGNALQAASAKGHRLIVQLLRNTSMAKRHRVQGEN